jgi:hypothetical protein
MQCHPVRRLQYGRGRSWDVSEDIAREILRRAYEAGKNLGEDTKRFINRHVADSTLPGASPVQTSPVDLIDRLVREAACSAIGSAQGDPSCRPEKIMIESD